MRWGETLLSREAFRTLARDHRVIPVARTLLAEDLMPTAVYREFGRGPGTFILESAEHGVWARWSFVGIASRAAVVAYDGEAAWEGDVPSGVLERGPMLDVLSSALEELRGAQLDGYPPLTGGLVGYLGWDVVREWETLPEGGEDDEGVPRVSLVLASDIVAIDRHSGTVWLIANAINSDGTDERVDEAYENALARLDAAERRLSGLRHDPAALVDGTEPQVTLRSSEEAFTDAVQVGKQAIVDGDVFQVVLSVRADVECEADPLDVYRVLRSINPSPYMYLATLPDPRRASGRVDVVGSSPETLVRVEGRTARTFPIAGSRPRGRDQEEDILLATELAEDPKERAEHLMLVDLARNDLAKVCDPGTVAVRDFMSINRFSHIMHITSTVTGALRPGVTALDALTATFPAGTLSGAPKVRAMELITDLEPTRRGVYGGVVGYFDFAGDMDMAIAIRTAVITDGRATVQAGAGIVADSVPDTEFIEASNKAAAAVRAIQIASRLRRHA